MRWAQVKRFMAEHGIPIETVPREKHGDCLARRSTAASACPRQHASANIVLMGHRDTVFPKGEPSRRPFRIQDGIAYGPGVADMKAGLVMNMFVLAAFRQIRRRARPAARPLHRRRGDRLARGPRRDRGTAREARVVFNSEPGRPNGGVVTGRKGGVFSVFDIEGKAAHSGGNFEAGISAIGELAAKITAIHALTDLERGITLNVGLVSGGQSVNTVAPWAQGQIDLRYREPADRDEVMGKIHAIIGRVLRPRHQGDADHPRRVPAADPDPGGGEAVRACTGGRGRERPFHHRRVQRRLRRQRLHRRGRARPPSAPSARSAARRTARRNTWRSPAWSPAPRPWRGPSCGWTTPGL